MQEKEADPEAPPLEVNNAMFDNDNDNGNGPPLEAELQKRADRADQSVLFFLAGANFWEKHAKNCAILCIFVYFLVLIFWGGEIGRC